MERHLRRGRSDRRRPSNPDRLCPHVHFGRAPRFLGNGGAADSFRLQRNTRSAADAGGGSACRSNKERNPRRLAEPFASEKPIRAIKISEFEAWRGCV